MVRGFRVAERDQPAPFADFDRLEARFHLPSLMRGHIWIRDLSVTDSTVRVVRLPTGDFNFSDLIQASGTVTRPLDVTVDRFALAGGTVTLEDWALAEPRTWTSEQITIEARNVSTRRDDGSAIGRSLTAGAPVSLEIRNMRLYPIHLQATMTIEGADLTPAAGLRPTRRPDRHRPGAGEHDPHADPRCARGSSGRRDGPVRRRRAAQARGRRTVHRRAEADGRGLRLRVPRWRPAADAARDRRHHARARCLDEIGGPLPVVHGAGERVRSHVAGPDARPARRSHQHPRRRHAGGLRHRAAPAGRKPAAPPPEKSRPRALGRVRAGGGAGDWRRGGGPEPERAARRGRAGARAGLAGRQSALGGRRPAGAPRRPARRGAAASSCAGPRDWSSSACCSANLGARSSAIAPAISR